jgi:hypothetical protein
MTGPCLYGILAMPVQVDNAAMGSLPNVCSVQVVNLSLPPSLLFPPLCFCLCFSLLASSCFLAWDAKLSVVFVPRFSFNAYIYIAAI